MTMSRFPFNLFKRAQSRVFLVVLLFALATPSCKHPIDPPQSGNEPVIQDPPCDPDAIYFQQDVLPLLVSSCGQSSCHDAITHEDGIIIESYASIMNEDGLIEPFDPGNSDLIEVLYEDGNDRMPPLPNAALTDEQIATLTTWIEQGALNLSCSECDTTLVTFSSSIAPFIATTCSGCHSGGAPSGGVDLTTHALVSSAVSYSNLMACIRQEDGFEAMPPTGAALNHCEIRMFELWLEDGMPNN